MTTRRPGPGLREAVDRACALLERPPLLVVSDFDGTIAPIVPAPGVVRIEPLGRVALRRLARLGARHPEQIRVVVLSGRPAADVAAHVRVGGLRYLGDHGLQRGTLRRRGRPEALLVESRPGLEAFAAAAPLVGAAVSRRLGRPAWLVVEEKGPSVAFHFRAAPDPEVALRDLEAALAAHGAEAEPHGLERFDGRKVLELRPPGAGGKGGAIRALLAEERPGALLVLGDDRSDAEGFRVLRAARERGEVAGLAVAVHGAAETPPELVEAADLVLASTRDAARLLSAVGRTAAARLDRGRRSE